MKAHVVTVLSIGILCLVLGAPAFAGFLYDNGPTLGTTSAYLIDVYQVSDSFVVDPNSQGVLSGVVFAEWVPAGATPLTVDWAVGTSSFGNDIASGSSATIYPVLLCTSGSSFNGGICGGGLGYDVYSSTVLPSFVQLTPGQPYWLTLTNATDSLGGRDGWDVNSGPSQAYQNLLGAVPSESFTITGTVTTLTGQTPEPNTVVLVGSGILGLASIVRRKLRS